MKDGVQHLLNRKMNHIKAGEANKCLEFSPRAQEERSSIPLSGGRSLFKFGCKPRLSKAVTWGQSRHIGHRAQPGLNPEMVNDRQTSTMFGGDLLPDVFHILFHLR